MNGIEGVRTLSEVNGRLDENSVREVGGNRSESTGIVTICMKISLRTFSYSGVDWGKVERGERASETRSGRDREEALASMCYRASSDIVLRRENQRHSP